MLSINIYIKDLIFLSILPNTGRLAFLVLAVQLNMSDMSCLRSAKKLEEAVAFRGYSANISAEVMGFNAMVYVFIRLTENSNISADLFENAMKKLPEVLECSVITGSHDYLLKIIANDLLSYESFVKKSLGSLTCIASIESTVVLKQTFAGGELQIEIIN